MFCMNCGQKFDDGTVFCPNCGQKQAGTTDTTTPQAPAYVAAAATVVNTQPQPLTYAAPAHATSAHATSAAANYPQPQPQPYGAYPAAKSKKRHGCLVAFIVFIVILLLAATAVYFLVPGLIKPNDLGIKSSHEAYVSAMTKLRITKDDAPKSGTADSNKITYGAPHNVSATLSSDELTSFLTQNRPPYYAVKNVQVRVNSDGTIEAAGNLNTQYVFNQVLGGQYTKQDAQKELPMLGLIPDNVNVYFKVSGSVENNRINNLNVAAVKIMGITLPQSVVGSANSFIEETLDSYISKECARVGANIKHLGVSGGKIDFQGSLPSSITRKPA